MEGRGLGGGRQRMASPRRWAHKGCASRRSRTGSTSGSSPGVRFAIASASTCSERAPVPLLPTRENRVWAVIGDPYVVRRRESTSQPGNLFLERILIDASSREIDMRRRFAVPALLVVLPGSLQAQGGKHQSWDCMAQRSRVGSVLRHVARSRARVLHRSPAGRVHLQNGRQGNLRASTGVSLALVALSFAGLGLTASPLGPYGLLLLPLGQAALATKIEMGTSN